MTAAQKKTEGLSQSWLDLIGNGGWKLNAQVLILQAAGTQDLVTDLVKLPGVDLFFLDKGDFAFV